MGKLYHIIYLFSTFFINFRIFFCYFLIKYASIYFTLLCILHTLFHSKQSGYLDRCPDIMPLCLPEGLDHLSRIFWAASSHSLCRKQQKIRCDTRITVRRYHLRGVRFTNRNPFKWLAIVPAFYAVTLCNPFEILIFAHKNSRHKNTCIHVSSCRSLFSMAFSVFNKLNQNSSSLCIHYIRLFPILQA